MSESYYKNTQNVSEWKIVGGAVRRRKLRFGSSGSLLLAVLSVAVPLFEKAHRMSDHLRRVAVVTVFVLVLAVGQLAFHIDEHPFTQILFHRLRQQTPANDVVPFGALLLLPIAVLPAFGSGEAELGDRYAAIQSAYFWVFARPADQYCLVDHVGILNLCKKCTGWVKKNAPSPGPK